MAKVQVPGNDESIWVPTTGRSNIPIGVRGSSYRIQVHLGTSSFPFDAGRPHNGITIVAKADAIRVVNTGKNQLEFEIGTD